MENKIDRILLNQRIIMKNLCFGFTELTKDEILNQSLLVAIEKTDKMFEEDTKLEQNAPQGHYENTGQVGENGNPIRRWIQDKQGIPSDEQEIKKELDKDYALDKQGEQE